MQTELYRHYDADGRLLYVGVSWSAVARYGGGHRMVADWARDSVTMTIERFATREQAMAAEAEAIKAEAPLHNGKPKPKSPPAYRPFTIDPSVRIEPERRQIGYALSDVPKAVLDAFGVSREHVFVGEESESRVVRAAREGDTVHAFGVQFSDKALQDLMREGATVVTVLDDGYLSRAAIQIGWRKLEEAYTDDEWEIALAQWEASRK